jgi:hypothetical protein
MSARALDVDDDGGSTTDPADVLRQIVAEVESHGPMGQWLSPSSAHVARARRAIQEPADRPASRAFAVDAVLRDLVWRVEHVRDQLDGSDPIDTAMLIDLLDTDHAHRALELASPPCSRSTPSAASPPIPPHSEGDAADVLREVLQEVESRGATGHWLSRASPLVFKARLALQNMDHRLAERDGPVKASLRDLIERATQVRQSLQAAEANADRSTLAASLDTVDARAALTDRAANVGNEGNEGTDQSGGTA